ncbi:MAG TPA: sigma-70 family RNA polymerase sigma factor [Pyrinomonadaceae bacterium]|nr:sigma-70 family RNA polymerase sigma factor [Pyrinomonadaceae bacterium]
MPDTGMARNLFFFGRSAAAPAPEAVVSGAQLVERARTGDQEAFNEIYKKFAPMVHGILLSRVPYDEVKDIVQDVFLTAYKNLHSLRDANAFGGWLARIARNQAVEYYRSSRPTVELADDHSAPRNAGAEAREALSAIRSLPEAYRETLVLRLIEGMTGKEIAEKTGLKPESVRVNLHRGMEMLRQRLGVTVTRK